MIRKLVVSTVGERWLIGALFVVAAAQRIWNVAVVPPLTGYDALPHMAYVRNLVVHGELPMPLSGWSTFHPPLYYLLGATGWFAVESLGATAVVIMLRMINVVASLAATWIAYRLLQRGGFSRPTVWVSTGILLFLPAQVIAATSVGNEGFAMAVTAVALLVATRLHRDPTSTSTAMIAGLLAGLAAISKYSGVVALVAVATPYAATFVGRQWTRRHSAALGALVLCASATILPVYGRNVALTGTPLPLTRTLHPITGFEILGTLRPRTFSDYLPIDLRAVLRPSLYHVPGRVGTSENRNAGMANIWGATHASAWFDSFGHRTSIAAHRDSLPVGSMLSILGVVISTTTLVGLGIGLRDALRSRLASWDAPLMLAAAASISLYLLATTRIPTAFVLKASYVGIVGVALSVAFARGCSAMPAKMRTATLVVAALALALAVLAFTTGLGYRPIGLGDAGITAWYRVGLTLPESELRATVTYAFPTEVERLNLAETASPFGEPRH